MYLSLLEFVYAVKDCESVEMWLAEAHLGGVLISAQQYDDEFLGVLASQGGLTEASQKMNFQPAICWYEEKCAAVYRVTTTEVPELVLSSFPFNEGEEWYRGFGQTAYLCLRSHQLGLKQVSWLATCMQIVGWDYLWKLSPLPMGRRLCPHL